MYLLRVLYMEKQDYFVAVKKEKGTELDGGINQKIIFFFLLFLCTYSSLFESPLTV